MQSTATTGELTVRQHGRGGPAVILLHGGPGAPGSLASLAHVLSGGFTVLEPFQRRSGSDPLTVARHVADLDQVVELASVEERPALVGHSWGAMLALAYAAAHPGRARSIALIGCGTFDSYSRARLREKHQERMDDGLRHRIDELVEEYPDPDRRLCAMGRLLMPAYSYQLISSGEPALACDARGHDETWQDMIRLQEQGFYPAAFSAIREPVLMLHGVDDPHPGRMIRDTLAPHVSQLRYHEWANCGHYPWLERLAREDFHAVLTAWLANGDQMDRLT